MEPATWCRVVEDKRGFWGAGTPVVLESSTYTRPQDFIVSPTPQRRRQALTGARDFYRIGTRPLFRTPTCAGLLSPFGLGRRLPGNARRRRVDVQESLFRGRVWAKTCFESYLAGRPVHRSPSCTGGWGGRSTRSTRTIPVSTGHSPVPTVSRRPSDFPGSRTSPCFFLPRTPRGWWSGRFGECESSPVNSSAGSTRLPGVMVDGT